MIYNLNKIDVVNKKKADEKERRTAILLLTNIVYDNFILFTLRDQIR